MGKVIKRDAALADGNALPRTADAPQRRSVGIISKDKAAARTEAESIRKRALAEADEIREHAETDAQTLKEKATKEGYAHGLDQAAAEISELVATTSNRLKALEAKIEPQLCTLAITIARKILGRELEFHPEAVADIVRQALAEKARQRKEISLRVHPEDLQYIRENKPALLDVLNRAKEIHIREDAEVHRHGVVIETDAGTIDAQLETQLKVFERVFLGIR